RELETEKDREMREREGEIERVGRVGERDRENFDCKEKRKKIGIMGTEKDGESEREREREREMLNKRGTVRGREKSESERERIWRDCYWRCWEVVDGGALLAGGMGGVRGVGEAGPGLAGVVVELHQAEDQV